MIPTAVFDTVILLQAGGKPGGPAGACLRLVMDDKITMYLSVDGLFELEEVLRRPKVRHRLPRLTPELIDTFLEGIRSKAQVLAEVPAAFRYPRDPDDEHVLNLAIAANVQFVVTRDNDLLDLMKKDNEDGVRLHQHHPGLTILDPVAFLARLSTPSLPQGPESS